jgi:hypothetical protein
MLINRIPASPGGPIDRRDNRAVRVSSCMRPCIPPIQPRQRLAIALRAVGSARAILREDTEASTEPHERPQRGEQAQARAMERVGATSQHSASQGHTEPWPCVEAWAYQGALRARG